MNRDLLPLLLETTLAASVVIPLLLVLRAPLRRWLGAGAAYASWLCVPVAVAAVLLPAREVAVEWGVIGAVLRPMREATASVVPVVAPAWQIAVLAVWLVGALAMAAWLWRQQHRFVRGLGRLHRREDGLWMAATSRGLPAVVGLFRTRIVVPNDFESRYVAQEQALIACHEHLHVRRGDLPANALVSALRCVYWFNPVIHLAARRFRIDQELACDEGVIRRHPAARRIYGEAMLKAQLDVAPVPLACHWPAPHPLRERISMLGRKLPSRRRRALAMLWVITMAATIGYGAWAAQPMQRQEIPLAGPGITPAMGLAFIDGAGPTNSVVRPIGYSTLAPPRYPVSGNEGKVLMRLIIGTDGRVTGVVLDRSSGFDDLDQAAMTAARGWRFEPAIEAGRAVVSAVRVPVEFSLDESRGIADPHEGDADSIARNDPRMERR